MSLHCIWQKHYHSKIKLFRYKCLLLVWMSPCVKEIETQNDRAEYDSYQWLSFSSHNWSRLSSTWCENKDVYLFLSFLFDYKYKNPTAIDVNGRYIETLPKIPWSHLTWYYINICTNTSQQLLSNASCPVLVTLLALHFPHKILLNLTTTKKLQK